MKILAAISTAFSSRTPILLLSVDRILSFLDKINKISHRHPVNVLVVGKQGCGKSSLVRQYAAVHRLPLATFQIGVLSEPGQLFGEYALENGETKYKQFLFPQAIRTPNCIIHLEEINRPEHPKALNMLFSILSDDRQVWMDELGLLQVAPGVVFFATSTRAPNSSARNYSTRRCATASTSPPWTF
ncbi:AAA family ATPase, partial [Georgfuchsia toluolica]|uniref:AAA family ATPase n=1 Tax=Georgfuchsia toluolica TaxID=424218 RepID=UPI001C7303AE